jgi:MFS superfamily sulfate permease-like transporter
MSISILIANILTFLAFIIHTFMGDKELKEIEPGDDAEGSYLKRQVWTMTRNGWHWISFDLLFATIGLGLIYFTDLLESEILLLRILSIYFFGYGVVWLIGTAISKKFPNNYLKLGQWILLWLISGLIYWGIN